LSNTKKFENLIKTIVYKDEPILTTAADLLEFTPPRYRQMRRIAKENRVYLESDPTIFYKQGKFMEDFQDDYEYTGEFFRYYPTYQSMNDRQLRGYFTWRTKVRQGIIERTSLSFVFVYIYELINGIGTASPMEGYTKLKTLWEAYSPIEPKINRYLAQWLKDYVIYYGLDRSLLENMPGMDFNNATAVLLDYQSHEPEEVFNALNSLSPYNLQNSSFYKQYPDEVRYVVFSAFDSLSQYHAKHRKNSLLEKFFGKVFESDYSIFHSAVFCNPLKIKDATYEVSQAHRFRCRKGRWSEERFFHYKEKNKEIGKLLKAVDFFMRKHYDFRYSLKMDNITKLYTKTILDAIESLEQDKRRRARVEVKIDVSKLDGIRSSALVTQERLITESDLEDEIPEAVTPVDELNPCNLTATEYDFVKCLLIGEDYQDLLNNSGIMESVIVDSINEKLFEIFDDNVIDFNGLRYEVYEDYLEELKGIFI
jgi:hypothetical protein